MEQNRLFQSKETNIIVVCERCHQKLRIPKRFNKLVVTCPVCKNKFYYLYGHEFILMTPTELKGLMIGISMIAVGLLGSWWLGFLPKNSSLPGIIGFLLFIMPFAGIVLLIVFAFLTLLAADDLIRFITIKRIEMSNQGIVLCKKDGSVDYTLNWNRIDSVQFQYLKHMFLGVIETSRKPSAIEFKLIDGCEFRIPLHIILKEKERSRFVSLVHSFLPHLVWRDQR